MTNDARKLCAAALMLAAAGGASAQEGMRPEMSEFYTPVTTVVAPGTDLQGGGFTAPSDAIVLFDGSDLSAWENSQGGPAEWTVADGVMTVGDETFRTDDPAAYLRKLLEERKSPRIEGLPSFTGGLVGYFSYDYIKYAETSADVEVTNKEAFRDLDLMLFDKVIAFDNRRQKLMLIVSMSLDDCEHQYSVAVKKLEDMLALLRARKKGTERPGILLGDVLPLFDREQYCSMMERAKELLEALGGLVE